MCFKITFPKLTGGKG